MFRARFTNFLPGLLQPSSVETNYVIFANTISHQYLYV